MRIDVEFTGLSDAIRDIEIQFGRATKDAVRVATQGLKEELRQQVRLAGMGDRLAKTWQADKTYVNDEHGLDSAGYVFSKAPEIITSYERGSTIRPLRGKRYLWLPTKSVPRARSEGRSSNKKRMTPEQVEREFRQPLIVTRGKGAHRLAFIKKTRGTTSTGKLRKVRRGRRAYGDDAELVLMFTLVPTTKRDKVLDIQGAADRWARAIPRLIENS